MNNRKHYSERLVDAMLYEDMGGEKLAEQWYNAGKDRRKTKPARGKRMARKAKLYMMTVNGK